MTLSKLGKAGTDNPDWTYTYDALDELITVQRNRNLVESYRYDAFERRSNIVTANDNVEASLIGLINDGADRTLDLTAIDSQAVDASFQIERHYTHSATVDEPLQVETFDDSGNFEDRYTYHTDHLGSIRFLTDAAGNISSAYDYDSYGNIIIQLESVEQPFLFTGREWDGATELYHYRARFYDPNMGRFISEDPIGFAAGDLNTSRYVWNNPLSWTDPSGLNGVEKATITAGSGGFAGAAFNIGLRLDCIFTAIGAGVALAGSDDLEALDVVIAGTGTALACGARVKFKKPKKPQSCKGSGIAGPLAAAAVGVGIGIAADQADNQFSFPAGTFIWTEDDLQTIERFCCHRTHRQYGPRHPRQDRRRGGAP